MFTGSTEVGKRVMERAAEDAHPGRPGAGRQGPDDRAPRTPISSEPPTARSTTRCRTAARRASRSSGCTSRSRSTTSSWPRSRRRCAGCARVCPGDAGSTDIGAVTSPPQVDLIDRHVQDAVAKGARILVGGKRGNGSGDFYEPTLIVDVDHSMECMSEETFGPTLPVMKVHATPTRRSASPTTRPTGWRRPCGRRTRPRARRWRAGWSPARCA